MVPKPKHYLGRIFVKTCPFCSKEFETDNKRAVYCKPLHQKNAKMQRIRERKYAEREDIPVSSKPGASYKLHIQEYVKPPPKKETPAFKTEVEVYLKAPVKVLSGFMPQDYNMPVMITGQCPHEESGYCLLCDLKALG